MTTKLQRDEIPLAYTMIAAAQRVRPRRDGGHPFQQYFLYWTAFNDIYATLAQQQGCRTRYLENEDGSIATSADGSVNIPRVQTVSEREQLALALQAFDVPLKHALIVHDSTQFFAGRIPAWQGTKIETDAFGQRVNGVINIDHTGDGRYPVWSPIDVPTLEAYLQDPNDNEKRDFLVRQIVALLATIRENMMHGGRKFDDANDISVVTHGLPLLELIVSSFTR